MNESLSDMFIESRVFKARILEEMKNAPNHVKQSLSDCDDMISKAINKSNIMIMRIQSAYNAGFEAGQISMGDQG